jgi:hypothetical protein
MNKRIKETTRPNIVVFAEIDSAVTATTKNTLSPGIAPRPRTCSIAAMKAPSPAKSRAVIKRP